VWSAVANIEQAYQRETPDIDSHVRRGKAGMLVLAWLAEAAGALDDPGTFRIGPHDDVVGAATAWLEASLTLREGEASAASQSA